MTIYACSSNEGKLREFASAKAQFGLPDVDIRTLPGLSEISPPEETGTTFEANAAEKAIYYSRYSDELVLADDSGLVVPALDGAPGIYSSRYAGPFATSAANNELLLQNLADQADRSAHFVCVLALARFAKVLVTFRGTAEGRILTQAASGGHGFGYDPFFFYPPLNASFAELDPQQKLSIGHRGVALRKLFAWLQHSRLALLKKVAAPLH